MPTHAAVIKRVTTGGTRNAAELKQQLKYLARKNRPDRAPVRLIESARYFGVAEHALPQDAPDQIQETNRIIGEFTQRVYQNVPPGTELNHNLTMHFVMSFPPVEDMEDGNGDYLERAETAGLEWAEEVFEEGYPEADGTVYSYDYVAAFHREGPDERHPHLHVVVNRRPIGHADAALLRIERDHPHFSYDAMRQTAVRVSARRHIALTFLPDLGEGEDLDLDILRMGLDYDAEGVAPDDVHDENHPDAFGDERTAADLARGCTPPGLMLDSPAPSDDEDNDNDSDNGDGGDGDFRSNDPSSPRHTPEDFDSNFGRDSNDDDDAGDDDTSGNRRLSSASGRQDDADDPLQTQSRRPFSFDDDAEGDDEAAGVEDDDDSLYRVTPPSRRAPAPTPPRASASDMAAAGQGAAQGAGGPSGSRKRPRPGEEDMPPAKRVRQGEHDVSSGPEDDIETGGAPDQSEPLASSSRATVPVEREDRGTGKRKRVGDTQDTPDKRQRTGEQPALAAQNGAAGSGGTAGSSGGRDGSAGPSQTRPVPVATASGAQTGVSGAPAAAQDPLVARRTAADSRRDTAITALQAHNRRVKQRTGAVSAQEAAALRAETLRLRRESVQALREQRRAYEGQTNVTTRAQSEARAAEDRRLDNRNSTDGSRDPGNRSR
ncbi:relaxase/mobilization nuclease domain-containing protein [Agrobacterium vitis]